MWFLCHVLVSSVSSAATGPPLQQRYHPFKCSCQGWWFSMIPTFGHSCRTRLMCRLNNLSSGCRGFVIIYVSTFYSVSSALMYGVGTQTLLVRHELLTVLVWRGASLRITRNLSVMLAWKSFCCVVMNQITVAWLFGLSVLPTVLSPAGHVVDKHSLRTRRSAFLKKQEQQLQYKLCIKSSIFVFSLSLRFVGEVWHRRPAVTAPTSAAWGRSPRRNSYRNPMWVTIHDDPFHCSTCNLPLFFFLFIFWYQILKRH